MKTTRWFLCGGLVVVVFFMFAEANRVLARSLRAPQGATINVNTTDDVVNSSDHACSLREAIISANADISFPQLIWGECARGSGADTINLSAGTYTLTLNGSDDLGDLDIISDITILGNVRVNPIIVAGPAFIDRIFEIQSSGNATMSNVHIQGGSDNGYCGGGIRNDGTLTISHVLFIANHSSACGGGLYNSASGNATLDHVSFGNNQAANAAGIDNIGVITLTQSSLTNNIASTNGGGMRNSGMASLSDVNIDENTAASDGGGFYNSGILTMTRVTIYNNTATSGNGGGIYVNYRALLINTTLSANHASATSGQGGGLYRSSGYYNIDLENVTINGNSAHQGGGLYGAGGPLRLVNTIVANSSGGGDCATSGGITSLGYNLIGDTSCASVFSISGDLTHIDPLLGSLENNGGKTETHALFWNSPAIDAGSNSNCPTTDQRDLTRPVDGNRDGTATCDIGAYERWLYTYLPQIVH